MRAVEYCENGSSVVFCSKYDVEYDERDLLQYRTSTLNDLLELENLPIMHVRCSYNNTYINICDKNGQVKAWRSCVSGLLWLQTCRQCAWLFVSSGR